MDREPFCPIQHLQQFELKLWPSYPTNGLDTFAAPKVHVNPNFRSTKSLVIHVNPRMHQKPMIHVNPKMMKDILPVAKSEIPQDVALAKVNGEFREIQSFPGETPIQKSIHVNPKLMERLSSIARADIEATTKNSMPIAVDVPSKTYQSEVRDDKMPSKSATTQRLLTISRRKLVRIGANSRTMDSANIKSPNTVKVFHGTGSSITKTNTKKSVNPNVSSKFAVSKHKHKLSTYKIDRTTAERNKRKKLRVPDVTIRDVNKGLVAIGGIMYQSSRTRLVRSSTDSSVYKKRKSVVSTKGDTFIMAKNGKKLHRLPSSGKDGPNVSRFSISRTSLKRSIIVKRVPSSIVHLSHKNVISYKAKQRSLQILRDKLRKNYIPCLIFRRFGYCANHAKGTCSKLHDKKQVALCRNFLQGKCLLDECPMSHDIGPEKMPTCKYFLEGCCIRDACPYLHVKVSSNTPLCEQFLRGYCAEGKKCKQRHAYICPEFEKAGKCPKGKKCPYPHKLKTAVAAASVPKLSITKNMRTRFTSKQQPNRISSRVVESGEDSRKRYYDKASPSTEQLARMRANILKQMKFIKPSLGAAESVNSRGSDAFAAIGCFGGKTTHDDDQESDSDNGERPRRPPIGPLPAYIPIN